MSTFVGTPAAAATPNPRGPVSREPKPEAADSQPAGKTRAELVCEAEELGVKVPPKANKAQIQKLIDEAPVM